MGGHSLKGRLFRWILCFSIFVFAIEIGFLFENEISKTSTICGKLENAQHEPKMQTGVMENLFSDVGFVVKYDTIVNPEKRKAQKHAWELIESYAIADQYMNDPYVTGSDGYYDYSNFQLNIHQYEELKTLSDRICINAVTDYQRIEAIQRYVAENIFYDLDFYYGKSSKTNIHPYEVWQNKVSVCAGYARLVRTLLIMQDIPCMDIYGENHEYNIAYDKQLDRWIFIDATWSSGNQYSSELGYVKGYYRDFLFDADLEVISRLRNHEIYNLYDLNVNGEEGYWLYTDREDWTNMRKWYLSKQKHAGRQMQ